MRLRAILLFVSWTVHVAAAEEAPILEEIQGRWRLVSMVQHGVKTEHPSTFYVFGGATMTVHAAGGRPVVYTLRIDSTKNPKQLDIISTWPDGSIHTTEAIFEIERDSLRWCHIGGRRPSQFPSVTTPRGTVISLKRAVDER